MPTFHAAVKIRGCPLRDDDLDQVDGPPTGLRDVGHVELGSAVLQLTTAATEAQAAR